MVFGAEKSFIHKIKFSVFLKIREVLHFDSSRTTTNGPTLQYLSYGCHRYVFFGVFYSHICEVCMLHCCFVRVKLDYCKSAAIKP